MIPQLISYLFLWYFFTVTTFGIWVPAGIFVPGMLMGCALGVLYLDLMVYGLGFSLLRIGASSYLVIGCAAMLSGYTRLTYSLAVVMMETTQSINLFIPIFVTIAISHGVGRIFNRSLYEYSIRAKQMPLLRDHVPKCNEDLRVRQMLFDLFGDASGDRLELVSSVCKVERLAEVMNSARNFSTLAVVNTNGALIGLIPKSMVIVLIEQHQWYEHKFTTTGETIEKAYEQIKEHIADRGNTVM